MQPYIFPYIGYFNLIHSVDKFVFYDDVNFIKKGWIHRNKILSSDKELKFTIPIRKMSQNKLINESFISEADDWRKKLLKQITYEYHNAPNFEEIFSLVEKIITKDKTSISELAAYSIIEICDFLNIKRIFLKSSDLDVSTALGRAERLIAITKSEDCDTYHNSIGGQKLYSKGLFGEFNVNLKFVDPVIAEYKQFKDPFISRLSIIDILMFNTKEETLELIGSYNLI